MKRGVRTEEQRALEWAIKYCRVDIKKCETIFEYNPDNELARQLYCRTHRELEGYERALEAMIMGSEVQG